MAGSIRRSAAAAVFCVLVAFPVLARDEAQDIAEKLEKLEKKVDRIEHLLTLVYGEKIERAERIWGNPGLAEAIKAVTSKYGLSSVADALTSGEESNVYRFENQFNRALRQKGGGAILEDPDMLIVLNALLKTEKELTGGRRSMLDSLMRSHPESVGRFAVRFLGDKDSIEFGLRAAALGEGKGLKEAVKRTLPAIRDNPVLQLYAYAALIDMADAEEEAHKQYVEALRKIMQDETVHAAAFALSNSLRRAGKKSSLWIAVELLNSRRYASGSIHRLSRIYGKREAMGREADPEERNRIYLKYCHWLQENYHKIRFDKRSMAFTLKGKSVPVQNKRQ